jgi:hypothetical protein
MSADKFDAEFAALHLQAAQMALDMADESAGNMMECGRWRLLAESAINRAHFLLMGKYIADAMKDASEAESTGGVQ